MITIPYTPTPAGRLLSLKPSPRGSEVKSAPKSGFRRSGLHFTAIKGGRQKEGRYSYLMRVRCQPHTPCWSIPEKSVLASAYAYSRRRDHEHSVTLIVVCRAKPVNSSAHPVVRLLLVIGHRWIPVYADPSGSPPKVECRVQKWEPRKNRSQKLL